MPAAGSYRIPDLAALYSKPYTDSDLAWRETGARDKAECIFSMLGSDWTGIRRVLEVGCGTGAVLRNLVAKRPDAEYVGVELFDERTATAQHNSNPRVHFLTYNGKHVPLPGASFDLVYATHVLEHVLDVRGFLAELRRLTRRYVYVEVPCELNLRATSASLQATLDIGHINAYTPASFALTLETSGLRVLKMCGYDHSFAVHRFHTSPWKALAKMALRRALLAGGAEFASRFFTYHWGAICEVGPPLNI